jgi:hypothetical protein
MYKYYFKNERFFTKINDINKYRYPVIGTFKLPELDQHPNLVAKIPAPAKRSGSGSTALGNGHNFADPGPTFQYDTIFYRGQKV